MTEQYLPTNINNPRIVRIEGSDYNVTLDDSIVATSSTTAPLTLTLPEARTIPGWSVCIKAQSVAGGPITIQGLNGQLIDGAASVTLSADNESVVVGSIGDSWVVCGGGSSGSSGENCLTMFLVSPDPAMGNFTSIAAAYSAAVAAGHGFDNPAKIYVCPGEYTENVFMNTAGIDIIAVDTHRNNEASSVLSPGNTRLLGRLFIFLTAVGPSGVENQAQWVGIDVIGNPPVGPGSAYPALNVGGGNFQVVTVADCVIGSSVPADGPPLVSVTNGGSIGPQPSVLNLIRVSAATFLSPVVAPPTILSIASSSVEMNSSSLTGQGFGDGDFSVAVSVAAGARLNATDSIIRGRIDADGEVNANRCSVFSTLLDIAAGGVVVFERCEVSRILSGDWVIGDGTFTFDEITWPVEGQADSTISTTITLDQVSSSPAGSRYRFLPDGVSPYTISMETNIIMDVESAAADIVLPLTTARTGPIRIKPTSATNPLTISTTGGELVDGAASIVCPVGGITLVSSEFLGQWESFG